VSFTAVAFDFLEPRDVRPFLPTEWPLNEVLLVEQRGDLGDLSVREFLGSTLWVDVQLLAHFDGCSRSEPADVPQGDVGRLVRRDVNALDTGHRSRSVEVRSGGKLLSLVVVCGGDLRR